MDIIRHHPYFDCWDVDHFFLKNLFGRNYKDKIMAIERPYCHLSIAYYDPCRYKHWARCSKDGCRDRVNRAHPYCDICECHHEERLVHVMCGRHHKAQRYPNEKAYGGDGWLEEL